MPAEPHHTDVDNKENNMTAVTADVGQEKKGKGTEEVPEEPPYTDAAAEAFVPAAVLGQDKTEKYYYVAPVMEIPEEPPHALVAKGDKQI